MVTEAMETVTKPRGEPVFPFKMADAGEPVEIRDGVWWLRLPLGSRLDHVNVYLLEDSSGWWLIDTGNNSADCRSVLEGVFSSDPFSRKPLHSLVVTHYHPDHIGLAGWFCDRGAILRATRVCWLTALGLHSQSSDIPNDHQVEFLRRAGVSELELMAYRRRGVNGFASLVAPLPREYRSIDEGDVLEIGRRKWKVYIGNGHAAGHATLWSDDGMAIVGDHVLSGISPNISIHPSEPDADLTTEWINSCSKFRDLADDDTLCLPGHNPPFVGIVSRCDQLIRNQEIILERLLKELNRPRTTLDCLKVAYRRTPSSSREYDLLVGETMSLLNHLMHRKLVQRESFDGKIYLWSRVVQAKVVV